MKEKIFISEYKIFKGKIYGLKQPTTLFVLTLENIDLKFIKGVLINLFELFEINNTVDDINSYQQLSQYILDMIIHIQFEHKIPVFHEGKVILKETQDKNADILFVLPYSSQYISELVLEFVIKSLNHLLNSSIKKDLLNKRYEILEQKFIDLKNELCKFSLEGINGIRLLHAAHKNDIEFKKLTGDVYTFGLGENSCWMESTFTNNTSCLGVLIARDKYLTNQLLYNAGYPVPKQFVIKNINQAVELTKKELNYPIVIKPINQDGGVGVFAGLQDEESLKTAFLIAKQYSENIIVEEHIKGFDYRLTVFKGKLIKTNLRLPGGVTGNGKNTISELVDIAQNHPQIKRRSKEKKEKILTLDDEAISLLNEYRLKPNTILEVNRFIPLRRKANAYTGGITSLINKNEVHPDNILLAENISKAINLDIIGIDLLIPNISSSWLEIGAGICEVNAKPQIGNSDTPEIYETILKELLVENGNITTCLYISDIEERINKLKPIFENEKKFGFASSSGNFLNGKQITQSNNDFFSYMNSLLFNKEINSAFITATMRQLIEVGFSFNLCDLLIIDNINIELYKQSFIENAIFPHVKLFIINADDKKAIKLSENIPSNKKILISKRNDNKEVLIHINNKGLGFYVESSAKNKKFNAYLPNGRIILIKDFTKIDLEKHHEYIVFYSTIFTYKNLIKNYDWNKKNEI